MRYLIKLFPLTIIKDTHIREQSGLADRLIFQRLTMKLVEKYPLQISLQSLSQILNQTITDAKYEEFNFCMLFSKKDGKVGN